MAPEPERVRLLRALAVGDAPAGWPGDALAAARDAHLRYVVRICAVLAAAGLAIAVLPGVARIPAVVAALAGCVAVTRSGIARAGGDPTGRLLEPLGLRVAAVPDVTVSTMPPRPVQRRGLRVEGMRGGRPVEIVVDASEGCVRTVVGRRDGAPTPPRCAAALPAASALAPSAAWDRVTVARDGPAVVVERRGAPSRHAGHDHTLLGGYDWRDLRLAEALSAAAR